MRLTREVAHATLATLGAGLALVLSASGATAGVLTYTCDPNIGAAVCTTLNTTIAGLYDSTFTNVSADIYIQLGTTGLGEGENPENVIPYSTYLSDYAANAAASGNPKQASALASLHTFATPVYAGSSVQISGALGLALGIPASSLLGFDASGIAGCTLSSAGCYEDVITITNDPTTPLFFRQGTIAPDAFDFFTVVEHETDEGLGTVSCIETQDPTLQNNCDGNESAADLFRYQSPGHLIPDSALSTTPGAYLSADGGVTNALGPGVSYNTLPNGEDYGDFPTDLGCPTAPYVQDGEACAGFPGLDITNDGGPEINILNTVGFDVPTSVTAPVPEPGTLALFGLGVAGLAVLRRRQRAA
jgi:hypothetical protein